MSRVKFGADGIRGIWEQWPFQMPPLTRIGQALGQYVSARSESPVVVMGRDTRKSGLVVSTCLMAGLLGQGVNVINLGVMTTPGVAYLTRRQGADMGLVVTASHSPGYMNGIKLVAASGLRLEREDEMIIEDLIEKMLTAATVDNDVPGHMTDGANLIFTYVWEHMKACPPEVLRGLRLVLDCSNGAASRVAPKIIRDLGAEVVVMNESLEGDRIGVVCGSEYIRQNPERLAELLYVHNAQYGFSFDGDGDRLVVVDLAGNVYDGHDLIYLLALHFLKRGQLRGKTVVITNQANRGLKPALQAAGIDAIETPNGDRHLEKALYSRGFTLGGEPGGNIIINDGFHTAADATYTAILVGEVLNQNLSVPLIERVAPLREAMAAFPQASRGVRVTTKVSQKQMDDLKAFGAHQQTLLGPGSRVEVRSSSTDPELFRVTVEGCRKEMREEVEMVADEISDQISELTKSGSGWNG